MLILLYGSEQGPCFTSLVSSFEQGRLAEPRPMYRLVCAAWQTTPTFCGLKQQMFILLIVLWVDSWKQTPLGGFSGVDWAPLTLAGLTHVSAVSWLGSWGRIFYSGCVWGSEGRVTGTFVPKLACSPGGWSRLIHAVTEGPNERCCNSFWGWDSDLAPLRPTAAPWWGGGMDHTSWKQLLGVVTNVFFKILTTPRALSVPMGTEQKLRLIREVLRFWVQLCKSEVKNPGYCFEFIMWL